MTRLRRFLAGSSLLSLAAVAACFGSSPPTTGVDHPDAAGADARFDGTTSAEEAGLDAPVEATGTPEGASEAAADTGSSPTEAGPDAVSDSTAPVEAGPEASIDGGAEASPDAVADVVVDSTQPEASACIPLSSDGACNAVVDVGTKVAATCTNGPPPVQTGGTVLDGTYALTAIEAYGPACPSADAATGAFFQGTIVVSGSCLQSVGASWDSTSDGGITTRTQLISFAGSQVTATNLCGGANGAGAGVTVTYTATPTLFIIQFNCPPAGCGAGQFPYTETYTKM
jgi:hypothetical protein